MMTDIEPKIQSLSSSIVDNAVISDMDLHESCNDGWLEQSDNRVERSDFDSNPHSDLEDQALTIRIPTSCDPTNQRVYLVYQSCFEKQMRQ